MFRASRKGIRFVLSADECVLLRRLITEHRDMLASTDGPVHDRLFPSASSQDETVAADYRELTYASLQEHKIDAIQTALATLPDEGALKAVLDEEQAEAWLVLLTDLRLALGIQLGVTEDLMEKDIDLSDPDDWPWAVLHYLGDLQASLVDVLATRVGPSDDASAGR